MRDNYLPEQLVFVDECASNRRIRCDRGRSLCGERAHKKVVFLRGRRYAQSSTLHPAKYLTDGLQVLGLARFIPRWNPQRENNRGVIQYGIIQGLH